MFSRKGTYIHILYVVYGYGLIYYNEMGYEQRIKSSKGSKQHDPTRHDTEDSEREPLI
jgi:hypothetical protein